MTVKKKILLVHPRGANWMTGEHDVTRLFNIMPPMGLLSLASWIEKHGHLAVVHDCYAFPGQDDRIFRFIRDERPDFIGVTATTSSFLDGIRLALRAKEVLPGIKTVFGGVHLSGYREKLLRDFAVIDYGVVGEGEQTLLELMEAGESDLRSIEGLIYRDDGAVRFTGHRTSLLSLDELPFPAYEKLEGFPDSYKLPLFSYPKAPNTTIITSRGCPYTCSYCDRSVFRRSYRSNSPKYMVELMTWLRDRFKIKHVNIYDDTFTLNRQRIMDFCDLKVKAGLSMTFNCAARSEQLDRELLERLKQAGCFMISLGIETGDPDLLKRHRCYLPGNAAEAPLENIRTMVHQIKKAGIRVKGLFMLGLPGETETSIKKSMDYVLSLPLDDFNLTKLTPFPGAPLYQHISEYGDFDENWEQMNAANFVFVPRGFTREKLEKRHIEFYRHYFARPRTLLAYVSLMWKSPDSWKRFVMALPALIKFKASMDKRRKTRE